MAANVSQISTHLRVEDVPHFSNKPITKIPKYVFENCNQVTCNDYKEEFLKLFREKTKTITESDLEKLFGRGTPQFIKKAEEYDWVYGLDQLEKELLGKTADNPNYIEERLTAKDIIKYNGLFARIIAGDDAGKVRSRNIHWAKRDLDANESLVVNILESLIFNKRGSDFISSLLQRHRRGEVDYAPKSWLSKIMLYYKTNPQNMQINCAPSKTQELLNQINPEIVEKWIKEQNSQENDKLEIFRWLCSRVHYFPDFKGIQKEIEQCLQTLNSKKMHPIEAAAYIWFRIVEIHISREANKRTGDALAAMIFLAHGYLPPKIGKADAEEYVKLLLNGFEDEQGFDKFLQYIMRKMIETHEEYKDKIDLSKNLSK